MSAKTRIVGRKGDLAPKVVFEERSYRFGPKGQPFHLVRYADGTSHMEPGLSAPEVKEMHRQFMAANLTEADFEQALADTGTTTKESTPA